MPYRRTLATLLTLALFFTTTTACTVCNFTDTSTKTTKRSVTVQPLFYKESAVKASGDFSNCKVTVETNKSGQPKVGFFEEEVAGSGAQWEAAGWMAAVTGSFLLGRDVADYKFSYEIAGYVDGPSAGALMTSAVLAALLGDEIKKDVTMTGTINPDGTIGPVGGIPQKLEGVKKAKKKVMLIPAGQRRQEDANTGEEVDVIKKGDGMGITVKEVADIYEAYKELTGKNLPEPSEASLDKVKLPAAVAKKLEKKTEGWLKEYEKQRLLYNAVILTIDTSYEDGMVAQADELAAMGEDDLGQGLDATAYDEVTTAYMYTAMAYHTKKAIQAYLTQGGLIGVDNYLSTIRPTKKIDNAFDKIKSKKPGTLADTMVLADAFGRLSVADGLVVQAQDLLDQEVETEEDAIVALVTATNYYVLANFAVDWSLDSIDVGLGVGEAKPVSKDKVIALSEALRKAAEANIEYFDSTVLKEYADSEGMSLDVVKYYFMSADFDYGMAQSSIMGAQEVKNKLGNTEARAYAVLGNSLQSFSLSSKLIAKYYSLQVETDENGTITAIPLEKAMINMLDFAEDSSLKNINSAKAAGALPVMAVISFDGAKVNREGTLDQKMEALSSFWYAGMQAKLLEILAGMKVVRTGESGQKGEASILGD